MFTVREVSERVNGGGISSAIVAAAAAAVGTMFGDWDQFGRGGGEDVDDATRRKTTREG